MTILTYALETTLLLSLAAASFWDLRSRTIPVVFSAGLFAAGLILQLFMSETGALELILGCCLGLLMLALAYFSRQAIGYGDGLVLTATGVFLGLKDNLMLLIFSLVIAAFISAFLLIFFRKKKNSAIPFLPCMLAGYICLLAGGSV